MIRHPWSGGKRIYCGQGEGKGGFRKTVVHMTVLRDFLN
jgi:hypothetical protein